MIYLVATLKIKPGSLPAINEAVADCIAGTRNEPGNISYDLFQSTTDEDTIVFVERWEDQAAIDNHFVEPHFLAWREAGSKFFLDRTIEIIEPANVKTL
ncbi:putative quinol monooxygenase [Ahrensia sp. R2A130]|uniref:putative quinol monooxygenase n=1 Tax=Ahrensia sp. R2A130 TaxID=744979 RepID=UPI0001E0ACB1|nr:putative quinol monooxygenase [Ahrensia sp. R2A130]EFL88672.1 antibiotic biosynthesis monooxygenase [Ahrensia sp. R2A130]